MANEKKQTIKTNTIKKKNIDDVFTMLKEALLPHDAITFVFLFGSFAAGKRTALSDIDVALFFSKTVALHQILTLREDLSELLGMEVDIVVLNNASPVIRMQVLKTGKLVFKRDSRAYNEFFVNTIKEYDDLKRNRREIEENILRGRIYA
jgi:hypothetical protein